MHPNDMKFTEAEIVLNVNNIGFDTLVCQTEIQTDEDKEKYHEQGYPFVFTESEFKNMLPDVDVKNIYYTPSFGQSAVYFNKETLAACPCHIEFAMLPYAEGEKFIKGTQKAIKATEEEVQRKEFRHCLLALPEAMSVEYFNLLLDKYPGGGEEIPDLFRLFFSIYLTAPFGFDRLKPGVFEKIIAARTEKDREEVITALADFPDEIRVYRGGSTTISRPVEKATSWTTSISTALFFAGRLGTDSGYIAAGSIPKSKVIYCQLETMEKEIIVEPGEVRVEETLNLLGVNDVAPYFENIVPLYHEYRGRLEDIEFEMDSDEHGKLHPARVLLMALMIAEMKGLPKSSKRVLAEAAIYHDSQRYHDGEDTEHGFLSADYYRGDVYDIDPLVEFIIEYHCRPDEEGYQAIQNTRELSKRRTKSRQLFDIFKDADALDRVRFGLQDLDINQLRTPEAKLLPLFAHVSVRMITL